MKLVLSSVVIYLISEFTSIVFGSVSDKWPTIGISVLVRNKAHTLPYFFSCIHNLDYPKDRIYIWIYSDFNQDSSLDIIDKWFEKFAHQYNGVYITRNNTSGPLHPDEEKPTEWTPLHFRHVISLREQALQFARKMWADYLFMLDADVFLTNPDTLKMLVEKDLPIVAPMLKSDGMYSNFWCGMSESYYYVRTDDYEPILNMEQVGCFQVPMVHSAVLISLRETVTDELTYVPENVKDYDGPIDDIIAFAVNAKKLGIQLSVCNDRRYGFLPTPLEDGGELGDDSEQIINVKLEAISSGAPVPLLDAFQEFVRYPQPWKFGFDEIFMINLERRPERRRLMELAFKELGMNVTLFKAVDGRDIDMERLAELGVALMPGYEDPYHHRPMTAGEIGCALSHYYIWEEIERRGLALALVLEDDLRFVPHARRRLLELLDDVGDLDWDLLYLGRKILETDERRVSRLAVAPRYSYWTLAYAVRGGAGRGAGAGRGEGQAVGAAKLLRARPLRRLLPVDELLPLLYNQHPNDTWKARFSPQQRSLVALSAAPLLVHPTHYTGQPGYLSDTEQSPPLAPPRSEL